VVEMVALGSLSIIHIPFSISELYYNSTSDLGDFILANYLE
jgi:hypothetical protein